MSVYSMCVFEHRFKTECARHGCECRKVILTLGVFYLENEKKEVDGGKEENSLLFFNIYPAKGKTAVHFGRAGISTSSRCPDTSV